MITKQQYVDVITNALGRDINNNINQKEAILASIDENQYIVAGPGSGKTTVIVLKVLKYIFVDGINPANILVTTFTNKAANELKNRINLWANDIINYLNMDYEFNLNNLIIGTLDSIAEDFLSKLYDINVIDKFTSSAIMMQTLLTDGRNNDKHLKQFFKKMKNNIGGVSTSDLNNQIQNIKERITYDMVDLNDLKSKNNKEQILYDIIMDYYDQLNERNLIDYTLLEKKFYEYLSTNNNFLNDISVVLIDEYQDTNYLQEQIYFNLARRVIVNNGSITVVGDDDQSLYRFRGANIDLFTNYIDRIKNELNIIPRGIFLQKNYRSTCNIIDFVNDYICLDNIYQKSRVKDKPPIVYNELNMENFPVFGMFRKNIEELSTDLSNLIYDLKVGNNIQIERKNKQYNINLDKNPSLVVLTNSPKEINAFNKKRLPFFIRETLHYKDEELIVFNPRGQNIESTQLISLMCGLILINIDPDSKLQDSIDNLPPHSKKVLRSWRKDALEYINENDLDISQKSNFVELLEVITEELSFLIKESTENTIYFDVILDTIHQTYDAITTDNSLTNEQIFWHILIPISSGAIEVDDDLFDFSLDDNVNIMSVHQSKGLEFDIVIVDVGSDIYNNQINSAFKRYPKNGGVSYNIEKYINNSVNLSYDNKLSGRDEAFNDLIRRYFVAYTRAKSILILVGLNSMKDGYKGDFQNSIKIQNVATGWSRDGKWHWENLDNLIQL